MRKVTVKHLFKTLIYCFLSFLFLPTSAQSTIVLDQITVNPETSNVASAVGKIVERNGELETAQTVTTGISGFLSKVDIWVGRQSDTTGDMILD